MAIACLELVTFRPDPLFNVPFFFRRIADSTVLEAPSPYLAMLHPAQTLARDVRAQLHASGRIETRFLQALPGVGLVPVPDQPAY